MTNEEETVLLLRGAIASLPVDEQVKVKLAYQRIVDLEGEFGEGAATFAVALRGAELQAEAD